MMRIALWALGLTLFAAADYVRIAGLDAPAVPWVRRHADHVGP
jgi:hypothetical protein